MSNEELVTEIQNGNAALYADLWEQLRGLIFTIANGYYALHASSVEAAGQTIEDLMQYGYIAMYNAVQGYESGKGCKFTTYLTYHIKSAFAAALGIRTNKRDGILYAASLDEPLDGEDSDSETFGETLPDKSAEFEDDIIDGLRYKQIKNEIAQLIDEMPEPLKSVTVMKMQGHSRKAIAQKLGRRPNEVAAIDERALKHLRSYKQRKRLAAYKDLFFDDYSGTGLAAFRNSQSSSVERIVERMLMQEYPPGGCGGCAR